MKAYLLTPGTVFGLITLVHLWRMIEEGARLVREPFNLVLTLLAAALCAWAFRLLKTSTR